MSTLATQTIYAGPMLSPQPPSTVPDLTYLDLEDGIVWFVLEYPEPDRVTRVRCGPLGAGVTWGQIPKEHLATYQRWLLLDEAEREEAREARDAYDDERRGWAHDFDSTRGL